MAAEAAEAPSSSSHPPTAFPATRQEIQAAIAKATELRALHAALLQGGANAAAYAAAGSAAGRSPAVIRVPPAASPAFPRAAAVAEDYPVFTPAYGEEPLGGMNYIRQDNRSLSENWSGIGLEHEGPEDEVAFSDLDNHNTFSSSNSELHFSSSNEHIRNRIPRRNHHSFLHPALSADSFLKSASRRTDSAESKATTTCNTCKPATISRGPEADANAVKNLSSGVPQSNHHPSVGSRTRQKGTNVLSWLLPKSKRKTKSDMSPSTAECENMSQLLKEWGVFSLESLKKELAEANEHRDAALQEVGEMRSSLGELTSKLLSLEAYSSELKKTLKKATSTKNSVQSHSKRSARSVGVSRDDSLPVSHEVMVEGFLQVVSEARLSIKQFCKVLLQQVEDADNGLADKLNLLLQPYQLTLADKLSKVILYHLEALMNQAMYQDFENCTFQKNGSPRCLDPKQDLQENFASFVALRNLSWNEVLKKGTKYYCEDFSRFCDQKMSCIVSTLSWSWPWAEQLLQCFFVAAKCIWLLHLLAFSFSPPLMVLRVEENRAFDPMYMEEIQVERQRPQQNPSRVKIMAMPGFYVQDRVLKCRVICRYGS
ncbi:IRK-interacting protein-like isoform X3 [Hordeum vulgare subsp. vulgare]|uniref:IRK-interacting protein n=1 Tax=Hordeum vulgare subsp. vulgare TaxID=112509 RepID=A0A8I6YE94_HORVV|nr:IRK-interacting protein-like isoform X3 [Hordeum vulgare subsp. vulgare]